MIFFLSPANLHAQSELIFKCFQSKHSVHMPHDIIGLFPHRPNPDIIGLFPHTVLILIEL